MIFWFARRFAPLLVAILCISSPDLFGQIEAEAQHVFDRYAEAIGGLEAYEAIESARIEMAMEIPAMNMSMKMSVTFLAPDRFLMDSTIPGMGSTKQGFDGEKGWSIDPIQGSRELKGEELEKLRSDVDFQEGLRLAEKYISASVTGISGEGLIEVIAIAKLGGQEEKLYFEKETGLLRAKDSIENMGEQGEIPVTTHIKSYQSFGDLQLVVHEEADVMGANMIMRLTSFEPNIEVDPSIFQMPE
jgi:hypothetical protein